MRSENKDISIYIKEKVYFTTDLIYATRDYLRFFKNLPVNPVLDCCCISRTHYINPETYFLKRGN